MNTVVTFHMVSGQWTSVTIFSTADATVESILDSIANGRNVTVNSDTGNVVIVAKNVTHVTTRFTS